MGLGYFVVLMVLFVLFCRLLVGELLRMEIERLSDVGMFVGLVIVVVVGMVDIEGVVDVLVVFLKLGRVKVKLELNWESLNKLVMMSILVVSVV